VHILAAGFVDRAVFSADGTLLLTASSDGRGGRVSVGIWDVASGRRVHVLPGHLGEVDVVAFSPDDSVAFTASRDGLAAIADVASGGLRHTPNIATKAPCATRVPRPDKSAVSLSFVRGPNIMTASHDGRHLSLVRRGTSSRDPSEWYQDPAWSSDGR